MGSLAQRKAVNKGATGKTTPPDRLISIAEAARRIGVSHTQVGKYIDSGYLTYGVLPSGRRMPSEASVNAFIQRALEGRL